MLLANSFFEQYGLILILIAGFGLIMVYYFLKNRKFQQTENDFQSSLKVGDKVKTYSGFYGVVEKITETTDGKVVSLRLGENSVIDVDIRALMGIDHKEEIKEQPVQADEAKPETETNEIVEAKQEAEAQQEVKEEVVAETEEKSEEDEETKTNSKKSNKKSKK